MIEDVDTISDVDIDIISDEDLEIDVDFDDVDEIETAEVMKNKLGAGILGGKPKRKLKQEKTDDADDETEMEIDIDNDSDDDLAAPEDIYVNISDYKIRTILIKPENNITSDVMSQYERAEAASIRIANISGGSDVFVDVADLSDPAEMAKRELAMRRHPYNILKIMNEVIDHDKKEILKYYEIWSPNEMMH